MKYSEEAIADETGVASAALTATPATVGPTLVRLSDEIAAARAYRTQAKSANTLRAYMSDWRQFEGWCDERGLDPCRPAPKPWRLISPHWLRQARRTARSGGI